MKIFLLKMYFSFFLKAQMSVNPTKVSFDYCSVAPEGLSEYGGA